MTTLATQAMATVKSAYSHSSQQAQDTHWRTYLMFSVAHHLSQPPDLQQLLCFLQYLHNNKLSPGVIANYLSSVKVKANTLRWPLSVFHHPFIQRFFKSIKVNGQFVPKHKGFFDLPTLKAISQTCRILDDPILYRAVFLLAFFGFLRVSNIAPHSVSAFSPCRHLLRKDVIFAPPGAHVLIKWAKNMQEARKYKFVQIPSMKDHSICPVTALKNLLKDRNLAQDKPLFTTLQLQPLIDTKIRQSLTKVLTHLNIPSQGHTFHAFRRSGAIVAFDLGVHLDQVKAHGNWNSDAILTYLRSAPSAPPAVARAFQALP